MKLAQRGNQSGSRTSGNNILIYAIIDVQGRSGRVVTIFV